MNSGKEQEVSQITSSDAKISTSSSVTSGTSDALSAVTTTSSHRTLIPLSLLNRRWPKFLRKTLAENKLGIEITYSEGDCFFDSVARGLRVAGIPIPNDKNNSSDWDCKKVRKLCSDYLQAVERERPDAIMLHWVITMMNEDATDTYQKCLDAIHLISPEMQDRHRVEVNGFYGGIATWGRPEIEGRILCEVLKIRLHGISLKDSHQKEEEEVHLEDDAGNKWEWEEGEDDETFEVDLEKNEGQKQSKKLITPQKILYHHEFINETGPFKYRFQAGKSIDYNNSRMIHIANYANHFVAIVRKEMDVLEEWGLCPSNFTVAESKEKTGKKTGIESTVTHMGSQVSSFSSSSSSSSSSSQCMPSSVLQQFIYTSIQNQLKEKEFKLLDDTKRTMPDSENEYKRQLQNKSKDELQATKESSLDDPFHALTTGGVGLSEPELGINILGKSSSEGADSLSDGKEADPLAIKERDLELLDGAKKVMSKLENEYKKKSLKEPKNNSQTIQTSSKKPNRAQQQKAQKEKEKKALRKGNLPAVTDQVMFREEIIKLWKKFGELTRNLAFTNGNIRPSNESTRREGVSDLTFSSPSHTTSESSTSNTRGTKAPASTPWFQLDFLAESCEVASEQAGEDEKTAKNKLCTALLEVPFVEVVALKRHVEELWRILKTDIDMLKQIEVLTNEQKPLEGCLAETQALYNEFQAVVGDFIDEEINLVTLKQLFSQTRNFKDRNYIPYVRLDVDDPNIANRARLLKCLKKTEKIINDQTGRAESMVTKEGLHFLEKETEESLAYSVEPEEKNFKHYARELVRERMKQHYQALDNAEEKGSEVDIEQTKDKLQKFDANPSNAERKQGEEKAYFEKSRYLQEGILEMRRALGKFKDAVKTHIDVLGRERRIRGLTPPTKLEIPSLLVCVDSFYSDFYVLRVLEQVINETIKVLGPRPPNEGRARMILDTVSRMAEIGKHLPQVRREELGLVECIACRNYIEHHVDNDAGIRYFAEIIKDSELMCGILETDFKEILKVISDTKLTGTTQSNVSVSVDNKEEKNLLGTATKLAEPQSRKNKNIYIYVLQEEFEKLPESKEAKPICLAERIKDMCHIVEDIKNAEASPYGEMWKISRLKNLGQIIRQLPDVDGIVSSDEKTVKSLSPDDFKKFKTWCETEPKLLSALFFFRKARGYLAHSIGGVINPLPRSVYKDLPAQLDALQRYLNEGQKFFPIPIAATRLPSNSTSSTANLVVIQSSIVSRQSQNPAPSIPVVDSPFTTIRSTIIKENNACI